MKKEKIEIFICDYCGQKHHDKRWMEIHEEVCLMNPKNQPCATCANQILGLGCSKGMNMEDIGENVLCFFYKKGYPENPFDQIFKLDGNGGDNNNDPNS